MRNWLWSFDNSNRLRLNRSSHSSVELSDAEFNERESFDTDFITLLLLLPAAEVA